MTASSQLVETHQASFGRLNGTGWCAENASSTEVEWLQIDFNRTIEVFAVATEGVANGWVTKFRLFFSIDGKEWTSYKQQNGSAMKFDRVGKNVAVDQHKLPTSVSARHVRFIPNLQHDWNCLKVEVYGIDDPCYFYEEIQQSGRHRDYQDSVVKCDSVYLPAKKTWRRFVGDKGTRLPTTCVPEGHCNADSPGWLNGEHPNVTQGVVSMKVCFHKDGDCCHYHQFISVKNCGSFYSYGLVKPPACNLRYCTDH
ncbi:pancreatic secretory granule membrane major glycoprotein GP2-like [Stylophora pistillata]|uniref:pancreatic secretory granule membrane major glycoprotein GP2-like n=1 Tax=Stylophora pistillata TaxID=50429 RepID=UPI000C04E69D|nr:pancreatic secretory granule membrane major glycoprotein GP2-like [Stylophora pistillata]